jgi:hypothetical protein
MDRTQVFESSEFKSGMASAEGAECSGCPSTSKTDENIDQAKEHFLENRKALSIKLLTCWEFISVSSANSERQNDLKHGILKIGFSIITMHVLHYFVCV